MAIYSGCVISYEIFSDKFVTMTNVTVVTQILAVLVFLCFVIKTIHFYKSTHRKKIRYWFYFPKMTVMSSHSPQSKTAKKTQNVLSFVLAIIFLITLISLLFKPV